MNSRFRGCFLIEFLRYSLRVKMKRLKIGRRFCENRYWQLDSPVLCMWIQSGLQGSFAFTYIVSRDIKWHMFMFWDVHTKGPLSIFSGGFYIYCALLILLHPGKLSLFVLCPANIADTEQSCCKVAADFCSVQGVNMVISSWNLRQLLMLINLFITSSCPSAVDWNDFEQLILWFYWRFPFAFLYNLILFCWKHLLWRQ